MAEALPLATGAVPVLAAAQRVASKETSLLPSSGHVLPVGGATIVKHTQAVNFGRGLGAVAMVVSSVVHDVSYACGVMKVSDEVSAGCLVRLSDSTTICAAGVVHFPAASSPNPRFVVVGATEGGTKVTVPLAAIEEVLTKKAPAPWREKAKAVSVGCSLYATGSLGLLTFEVTTPGAVPLNSQRKRGPVKHLADEQDQEAAEKKVLSTKKAEDAAKKAADTARAKHAADIKKAARKAEDERKASKQNARKLPMIEPRPSVPSSAARPGELAIVPYAQEEQQLKMVQQKQEQQALVEAQRAIIKGQQEQLVQQQQLLATSAGFPGASPLCGGGIGASQQQELQQFQRHIQHQQQLQQQQQQLQQQQQQRRSSQAAAAASSSWSCCSNNSSQSSQLL